MRMCNLQGDCWTSLVTLGTFKIITNSCAVLQARSMIKKGDVISIVDPVLIGNVKIESIWRIAEVAIQCVEQRGFSRPKMQEIVLAIQDSIKIEKGGDQKFSSSSSKGQSSRKTLLTSFLEIESPDLSNECLAPAAR